MGYWDPPFQGLKRHRVFYGVSLGAEHCSVVRFMSGKSRVEWSCDVCVCVCLSLIHHYYKIT